MASVNDYHDSMANLHVTFCCRNPVQQWFNSHPFYGKSSTL